jgi:hypothetical protein
MFPGSPQSKPAPHIALSWYGAIARTTIGDLYALENVSNSLTQRRLVHVVLSRYPLRVSAPVVSNPHRLPKGIKQVVHVCGPLLDSPMMRFILLQGQRRTAVGVSVLDHAEAINGMFHTIVARDGRAPETFDLALARFQGKKMSAPRSLGEMPVVAMCLRGQQGEYGAKKVHHERAEKLFVDALQRKDASIRPLSTRLTDDNPEAKILADFERADVVATTRLHGALFALALGKPVLALDQVGGGGAKVRSVLTRIGWPLIFDAENASQTEIDRALSAALSPEIVPIVERCRDEAIRQSVAALEASVEAIAATAALDAKAD